MALRAMNPQGKTVLLTAATTAPDAVAIVPDGKTANQCRVYNAGSVLAHISFDPVAATAKSSAVIPTGDGSNSKYTIPVAGGASIIVSVPLNTTLYASGITASSTAAIYLTPCEGGL